MTRRPRCRALWCAGLAVACLAWLAASVPSRADTLVVDLSQRRVAITAGFAGADVLLFGAVEQDGDIVVVVRGPDRPVVMRRKSRILGVWVNTARMTFARVPSFYAAASSRPLDEIAARTVLARNEIGVENLHLNLPSAKASANVAAEWRRGLIGNHQALGLFQPGVGPVSILFDRLFRADIRLPANVPPGAYQVITYLFQDGRIVSAERRGLEVRRIGAEALIFDFAHEQSALYGLFAITVAMVAGWLGYLAFGKM